MSLLGFLLTSQLVFHELHLFTPSSPRLTSIFLEGLLGSFFFTGFNWNLRSRQGHSELHQQQKPFTVALHILLYICHTCANYIFPSWKLFHRAIPPFEQSITKEHDAHTFTSQSYPGGWIWQSFHFLDMFLAETAAGTAAAEVFSVWNGDTMCSHSSWIVQLDMSDYRTV